MEELLYRRSLGGSDSLDPERLHRAIESGVSGYDRTEQETYDDDETLFTQSNEAQELNWLLSQRADMEPGEVEQLAAELVDHAEVAFEAAKATFLRVSEMHPRSLEVLVQRMHTNLDERRSLGEPITDIYYQEAHDLVHAIAEDNLELDQGGLAEAIDALLNLRRAEDELETAEAFLLSVAA